MNTLRNVLKEQFSQIPNEMITDLTISAGELRVLLYLFTKPDDWSVYNKDICKQLDINEKTLTKYWKNLLESKWLQRDRIQNEDGTLSGGYVYRIGNFNRIGTNTVSPNSSETDNSGEHSNTKPINKHLTSTNTKVTSSFMGSAIRVSAYLHSRILKEKPNFKQSITNWEQDIERAIRIDNRTEVQLIACIDWIYSSAGSFWIPNIMSGKKLREKFDTMESQMMRSGAVNIEIEKNLKMMEDIRNEA